MTQMVNKANSGHHPTRALLMSALTKLQTNRAASTEFDNQTPAQTAEEARNELDAFLNEMAANMAVSDDNEELQKMTAFQARLPTMDRIRNSRASDPSCSRTHGAVIVIFVNAVGDTL